jgi:hypothetical protein
MPTPDHLSLLPWYGPHQAWVAQTYGYARHDPTGEPARAVLTGANLQGANLRRHRGPVR